MHAKPDLRVFLKWVIACSGPVIVVAIQLRQMLPKRFTSRALLSFFVLLSLLLAIDSKVSSVFENTKLDLKQSPTQMLTTSDAGAFPSGLATWHTVDSINDTSTLLDRTCFRRSAEIWHTEYTLVDKSTMASFAHLSTVTSGLNGVEVQRHLVPSAGDMVWHVDPNSVEIPKHAVQRE